MHRNTVSGATVVAAAVAAVVVAMDRAADGGFLAELSWTREM